MSPAEQSPFSVYLTVRVSDDDEGGLIARCEELGTVTCGSDFDDLRVMVGEMIAGYFETCARTGTLDEVLTRLLGSAPEHRGQSLQLVTRYAYEESKLLSIAS